MKKPDPGSKACSLGVLADLFDALGGNAAEGFIKQLFPTFQQFTKVLNNLINIFKINFQIKVGRRQCPQQCDIRHWCVDCLWWCDWGDFD